MGLFGLKFTVKRQPRWGSYDSVQTLYEEVRKLGKAVEAMRVKVYRDDKDNGDREREISLREQPDQLSLKPGDTPPPGLF